MIFAKLLKLRDKLTNKRKNLTMDDEKPFLEHLEDLRKMLMKITITMLSTMVITMFWYQEFFEIVKLPAKWAGLAIVEDPNRPAKFDYEHWEKVKSTALTAQTLSEPERTAFFAQIDPESRLQARAMVIYQAASFLAPFTVDSEGTEKIPTAEEIKHRDDFIATAVGKDKDLLATVQKLVELKTRPEVNPAKPAIDLVWRKPSESFFTAMKLALYAGALLAFPLVFYFILEFVLPGMTPRERKLLWPALTIGFGLFLTGMLFAFFWVVPRTLLFFHLFSAGIEGTQDLWTVADYTSFVTVFSLVFGASFELPVVVLVMVKLGLLSTEFMRRTRSWAVVIIVIVAAVITPTGDPGTLAALAVPMIIMYEACIWIAVWMEKKSKAKEAEEERESARRHAEYALTMPVSERSVEEPASPSTPPEPVLHPDIQPYRNPNEDAYHDHDYHNQEYHDQHHQSDADHDTWLKEQEEMYRKEHAHLFGEEQPEVTEEPKLAEVNPFAEVTPDEPVEPKPEENPEPPNQPKQD